MKLGRLLLLAGAAIVGHQLLTRTEKGKQLTKDLTDNAGKWKDKVSDVLKKTGDKAGDYLSDSNPAGNIGFGKSGSPD